MWQFTIHNSFIGISPHRFLKFFHFPKIIKSTIQCSIFTIQIFIEYKRYQFSILNSQYSILNTQFSILNTQFSILNSQFSILNSQFSIFIEYKRYQYSILNTQFSILNSQFSILNSQFSMTNFLWKAWFTWIFLHLIHISKNCRINYPNFHWIYQYSILNSQFEEREDSHESLLTDSYFQKLYNSDWTSLLLVILA